MSESEREKVSETALAAHGRANGTAAGGDGVFATRVPRTAFGQADDGEAEAGDKLVKKVKAGGSGVWGAIPMTPHPNLKDEDVKVVIEWILALK